MSEQSVAQDLLQSYSRRIMAILAEVDDLQADKREIYKEARANGLNPTVLGKVIGYLRSKDKDADRVNEREALFDLYLEAITGTPVATRTQRETEPQPQAAQSDAEADDGAAPASGLATKPEGRLADASPSTVSHEAAAATETAVDYLREPAAVVPGQIIREGDAPRETDRLGGDASRPDTESRAKTSAGNGATVPAIEGPADCMSGEVSRLDAGRTASATSERMDATVGRDRRQNSEPQQGSEGSGILGREATVDSPAAPEPEAQVGTEAASGFTIKQTLRQLHCRNPQACGSMDWKQPCYSCRKAAGLVGSDVA